MNPEEIAKLTDEEVEEQLLVEVIDGEHVGDMPSTVENEDGVIGDDIPDKALDT